MPPDPPPDPKPTTPPRDESLSGREPRGDRLLTWAALLGRWTDFARSALALPKHGDAGRVRQSVVSIITLQAITHALGEVDLLDHLERAVALDRAEILTKLHAAEIHHVWRGEVLPGEIQLLIGDARRALRTVRSLGAEWRLMEERFVARHPGELVMALKTLVDCQPLDLYLPSPGTTMFLSSPVAFARFGPAVSVLGMSEHENVSENADEGGDGVEIVFGMIESFLDVTLEREIGVIPHQVYRQFDFAAGGPVRDIVMPMNITIEDGEHKLTGIVSVPAGQPLLIPAILGGEAQPVPLPPRAKGKEMGVLPVVFEG